MAIFRPSGIQITIREDLVAGSARVQTTLNIDPIITKDGHRVTMSDLGNVGFGKIDQGKSSEEIISWTGMTDNTTYYTLTGVTWGYDFYRDNGGVSANMKQHFNGAQFKITNDDHFIARNYLNISDSQSITGLKTFSALARPKLDSDVDAVNAAELLTLGQLQRVALGTINTNRVIVAGNAGETIAIRNVLYFDETLNQWKKALASSAALVNGTLLGIAQGAGTAGNAISGGVLIFGYMPGFTGLVAGDRLYITDTATVSPTPGTVSVEIGYVIPASTTEIYFSPRFASIPTAVQLAAMAGASGTPGSTNKFETENDTSNAASMTGTGISFTASTKTIADSGNGFVTAGFRVGQSITVSGSVANNSTFTIVSVAAGAIVVSESLTDGVAGPSVTITTVTANKLARLNGSGKLSDSLLNTIQSVVAGESLATADLLKLVNESGTAKLKKIIGAAPEMTPTMTDLNTMVEVIWLTSTTFVILYWINADGIRARVGTISSNVVTFGTEQSISASAVRDFIIRKIDTTRFIVGYRRTGAGPSNNSYVIAGSVSGTTITLGTEVTIENNTATSVTNMQGIGLVDLGTTGKFAFVYYKETSIIRAVVVTVSGTTCTPGAIVNVKTSNVGAGLSACALGTDKFVITVYDSSTSKYVGYACTVATTTITVGSANTDLGISINVAAVPYQVETIQLTTDVFAIIAKTASAKATLSIKTCTVSGTTITAVNLYQEASFTGNTDDTDFSIALIGNILYVFSAAVLKFLKYRFDGVNSLQRMSLSPAQTFNGGASYHSLRGLGVYNDRLLLFGSNNNTVGRAILGLPDWDEFITSAKQAFSTGDNVPISEVLTGFSSLVPGMKYYVKADETTQGVTIDSTYQYVGRAVSSTVIFKERV